MKKSIIIACSLVALAILAFVAYERIQIWRFDAEFKNALEQAKQEMNAEDPRAMADSRRLEEEKAAKAALMQAEAENNKLIDEAWNFITAKMPVTIGHSYEKIISGWLTDSTTYRYYKSKHELYFVDRKTVIYQNIKYGDTTSSSSIGPVDFVDRYQFDLSEIDPTRISTSTSDDIGIHLYIREDRKLIKNTYKGNTSYTEHVYIVLGDLYDSERRVNQMAKAFYQLVTACGGHGEKF